MSEQATREMTLDEYVGALPGSHAAHKELSALRRSIAALSAALNRLYVVRERLRGGISYNRLADEIDTQLEELGPPAVLRAMLERAVREGYEAGRTDGVLMGGGYAPEADMARIVDTVLGGEGA